MRISLNWLRTLVDFDLSPEELAETLTLAGFEVEDIDDRRALADGVVVGYVAERSPHPNADRLSVCQVDIGQAEPLTIVCGAKNVAQGQYVPVATLGTYLPALDLKLKPTKLRGVKSQGMICSLTELGLEKDADGIHVFGHQDDPGDLAPGQDVRPLLGLDDVILDLTSTANRADALSMVGVAREVAALTGSTVCLPLPRLDAAPIPAKTVSVTPLTDNAACTVYTATMIAGVTLGPSPEWLQRRLAAAGVRPISNVVDVTNYVMLEWGQPLHAFDYDHLLATAAGTSIALGVRLAQPGESLTTLDSQARSLPPTALLITANDRPVALAGLMGGEATEVGEATTNLLLEAAWFDPGSVRRSGRGVGLRTEASTRFERGVNQVELDVANRRAVELLLALTGGQVVGQAIADARPSADTFQRSIPLRLDRVHQVLGQVISPDDDETSAEVGEATTFITAAEVEQILTALNCQLTTTQPGDANGLGREWTVVVPPYRYRDLEREIDLIEELARLYGYNRFCSTLPSEGEAGFLPADWQVLRQLRSALRGAGLTELMHYSLVKPGGDRQIELSNPLFVEYSALRTEMLTGLIDAFQYNWEQGNGALNGFEVGRVFWSDEEGYNEADRIVGILGGDPSRGKWVSGGRDRPLTWYEAKGILESVLDAFGLAAEYQSDRSNALLHPGRTASLWLAGDRLGTFGQIHPQICQERDLPEAIYVFDLSLELFLKATIDDVPPQALFKPYSSYPASGRDLAMYAPTKLAAADLQRTMLKAGKPLLNSVEVFDEYRGEHVPEGQRSLAFRLLYRSSDRTLTDAEVDPVHQAVRDALLEKYGVNLRS